MSVRVLVPRRRRRRRIPRKRVRAFGWVLVLVTLLWFGVAGWPRWLTAVAALTGLLVLPVLGRGSRSAARELLFSSRQRRIAERKPYWDPVAGREVRPKRPAVPGWQRQVVYAADRNRCVYCHRGPGRHGQKQARIQLDHIKPYSLGFNLSLWNSATLCAGCNQVKSNYWLSDSGKAYYRPFAHAASMGPAGKIARREMRVRLYPWRLLRMGRAYWLRKGR